MTTPDLNLLLTLEAVLAEGSVARAAQRLHLSPSAMSRALQRLRDTTGDPLLVRAGRGLVPTPRALELRERVGSLVQEAQDALRPVAPLQLNTLERCFTLRTREGFVENFGAALLARIALVAPKVSVCFVPKPDKESRALRDASVDLETGVVAADTAPELRAQALFRDRFIGIVRRGHALSQGQIDASRYAGGAHISVSRRGLAQGAIDQALAEKGLQRHVVAIVASYSAALALAQASDLIVSVPARHTANLRHHMHSFALPLDLPDFTVSLLWHPRLHADLAHRWLRGLVVETCSQLAIPAAPNDLGNL